MEGVEGVDVGLRGRGRVAGRVLDAVGTLGPGPGEVRPHARPVDGAGGPGEHARDASVAGVKVFQNLLAEGNGDHGPVV